jgi:hypothetical protein
MKEYGCCPKFKRGYEKGGGMYLVSASLTKLLHYNCVKFHKNSISSLVRDALTRYMPPPFSYPLLNFGQQPYSFMHICR